MGIICEKFAIGGKYSTGTGELFSVADISLEDCRRRRIFHRDNQCVLFRREATGELLNVRLSLAQRLPLKRVDR